MLMQGTITMVQKYRIILEHNENEFIGLKTLKSWLLKVNLWKKKKKQMW